MIDKAATTGHHIGFDARYLSHGLIGGVHTYVRNLVGALCGLTDERRWTLYADTKAPFELGDLPTSVQLRTLPWRNGASSIANDLGIGAAMRRDGVSIAHAPANYGFTPAALPLVVTLHDAINLLPLRDILQDDSKHPRHMLMMAYLHLLTIAAMRRKPFVITVSHYSRQEILRHAALPPDRVHVVHSAHERDFRPLDPGLIRGVRERLRLRPRMLVADAIKNPACVLRAYRALPTVVREDTSLVFFARRPPAQEVQEAAARGECHVLLRPSRDKLIELYNLADFFVFPLVRRVRLARARSDGLRHAGDRLVARLAPGGCRRGWQHCRCRGSSGHRRRCGDEFRARHRPRAAARGGLGAGRALFVGANGAADARHIRRGIP